jgi:DNA-directed RNA polymerase specialized sigma24 family protein
MTDLAHVRNLLENWGRWAASGKTQGLRSSLATNYRSGRSVLDEVPMFVVDQLEASRTDDAVMAQPQELRTIAALVYREGLTYRFIATELQISTTTVTNRVERLMVGVDQWYRDTRSFHGKHTVIK